MTHQSDQSPSQNTRQDKESCYSILAGHLRQINQSELLLDPFLLSRLDEGIGVEAVLSDNDVR